MEKAQRAFLAVTTFTSWNKSMIRALKEFFEEEKRFRAYGASENLLQTGLRLKHKKWDYVIKLWHQRPTEPSRKQAIKNDYIRFIINNEVKFTEESVRSISYELFSLDRSAKQLEKNLGKMPSSILELHNLAVTMLVNKGAGTAAPDATGWLELTIKPKAPPPPAQPRPIRHQTLYRTNTNPPGYLPPEFQVPPVVVPTAPPAVNLPPTIVTTAPPTVAPVPVVLPPQPSLAAPGKKAPPPSKPKKVYGGRATRKRRTYRKGTRRA